MAFVRRRLVPGVCVDITKFVCRGEFMQLFVVILICNDFFLSSIVGFKLSLEAVYADNE
jgi:hypothetical protein